MSAVLLTAVERVRTHLEVGCAEASPEVATVLRRMRTFGLVSMVVVGSLTVSMSTVLGDWKIAAVGAGLIALLGAIHALAPRRGGRFARALAHASLAGATFAIPIAILAVGSFSYAGVFLHVMVVLAAAHLLGVRSALVWTGASLVAAGAIVWLSPLPPGTEPVAALVFRGIVLTAFMAYAIAVRWAEDTQAARLELLARTDSLTGLANRTQLFEELGGAIERARRFERVGALLYIDLDRFKPVNDEFGHDAGDEVLRTLAARILGLTRSVDRVARLGGDEFAVLLSEVTEPKGEAVFARRLQCLAAPVAVRGGSAQVGASVGIAMFPSDGSDAETVLWRADEAMYEAKRAGGDVAFRWSAAGCRRVD